MVHAEQYLGSSSVHAMGLGWGCVKAPWMARGWGYVMAPWTARGSDSVTGTEMEHHWDCATVP